MGQKTHAPLPPAGYSADFPRSTRQSTQPLRKKGAKANDAILPKTLLQQWYFPFIGKQVYAKATTKHEFLVKTHPLGLHLGRIKGTRPKYHFWRVPQANDRPSQRQASVFLNGYPKTIAIMQTTSGA